MINDKKVGDLYFWGYETTSEEIVFNGVFHDLNTLNVPWRNENISDELDMVYLSRSKGKILSPMVQLFYSFTNNRWLRGTRSKIAETLVALYGNKWDKLYNLLSLEYRPIENYRMTETESISHNVESELTDTGTNTVTDTGTDTTVETGTDTVTDTGTDTTVETGSITVTDTGTDTTVETGTDTVTDTGTVSNAGTNSASNSVYGFNSANAVNSDATTGNNSDTETRNLTRQETKNLNTQETRNLEKEETRSVTSQETKNLTSQETKNLTSQETKNLTSQETRNLQSAKIETGENERELTRFGNIGVTTTQQMMKQEIELWQWNFFETVFADIDNFLTIPIY